MTQKQVGCQDGRDFKVFIIENEIFTISKGKNFVKGIYAVAVSGLPPDDAITDYEEKSGKRYIVRSRT